MLSRTDELELKFRLIQVCHLLYKKTNFYCKCVFNSITHLNEPVCNSCKIFKFSVLYNLVNWIKLSVSEMNKFTYSY